jgi:deazaflavin-dependent oxidoreductase (nitroreductase family)
MTSSSEFRRALNSSNELKITFVGRKTGKKYSTPVWFATNEAKLYLLPVGGTKSNWYKNVLKNPKMELQVSGQSATAEAHSSQDKKLINETMDRFRSKYGAGEVKKYYPRQDVVLELSM